METFRLQYIRCGKRSCKTCPHGPYWYAFRTVEGKTRSRYCGKRDPREPIGAGSAINREASRADPWEAILSRRTACLDLACEILGVNAWDSQDQVEQAFRSRSRVHHPDRGGDERLMICLEGAFSFVVQFHRWSKRLS